MEKTYINYYPFSISAETKTSKAGKQYTSIGICQKSKDKDGNKKETYFNLIDERELLVLAEACKSMYDRIIAVRNDEFLANKTEEQTVAEQPQDDPVAQEGSWNPVKQEFEDEIPF